MRPAFSNDRGVGKPRACECASCWAALPRPCPHTQCRHHLPFGCVLDVATEGAHTQEEVAAHLGVTRQTVDILEKNALRRLRNTKPRTLRRLLELWRES